MTSKQEILLKQLGFSSRAGNTEHDSYESLTNGSFVMLQNGLVLSPKDVLKNKEETMWSGRFVGNAGDEFCGMNKTKLLGMMPYRRDSIVVMDFWEVEYPEGGTDGEDIGFSDSD